MSTKTDTTKKKLYHDTFKSYKNKIKKTWATINDTLGGGRNQNKLPTYISCIFRHITEEETMTIIDNMENKSSSGYDGISNKMLKYIKKEISKPLTLIIDQMLDSGIFPSVLKISKILPIFKKGDVNSLNNYLSVAGYLQDF